MNTASTQNEQRRLALWQVALWSIFPLLISVIIGFCVYHSIEDVNKSYAKDQESATASAIHRFDSLNQLNQQMLSELENLYAASVALAEFIKVNKKYFNSFSQEQRQQLESEMARLDISYEEHRSKILKSAATDTLVQMFRRTMAEQYALSWSQAKHEALSSEAERTMLRQQVEQKEGEITDLRLKLLMMAKESSTGASTPYVSIPKASNPIDKSSSHASKTVPYSLNTSQQASSYKQCLSEQIASKRQISTELQAILKEKKKFGSVIPEMKALIRDLNQEVEKMQMAMNRMP